MDNNSPEYVGYDLFPEVRYKVTYDSNELIITIWGPRIIIWFVITVGDHSGELLPYFCPMKWGNKQKGSIKFGKGSKYEKLMRSAVGWNGKRRDRCSTSKLKGIEFEAVVKTVKERKGGTPYPEEDYYSKIEELIKL